MKVYKRNGQEVDFALDKIKSAINKANKSTFEKYKDEIEKACQEEIGNKCTYEELLKITDDAFDWSKEENWNNVYKHEIRLKNFTPSSKENLIKKVSKYILVDGTLIKVIETTQKYLKPFDTATVEDISDLIEKSLMKHNSFEVAKEFITYRDNKRRSSKFTDTELKVLSVIDGTNEELRGDNANKHIDVNSSARDYIAGTVCKSIADKILPSDITKAHKDGYIHWHDKDYSPIMHMTNCGLVDAEDMFKNGFQMGDVSICSPSTISTASNLASQISLIVSGLQYGGQTMSLSAFLPIMRNARRRAALDLKQELLNM